MTKFEENIEVKGARVHNLKNHVVTFRQKIVLPRNSLELAPGTLLVGFKN